MYMSFRWQIWKATFQPNGWKTQLKEKRKERKEERKKEKDRKVGLLVFGFTF